MADINDEYLKYAKDPRIACKYGLKCYQKNDLHHKKYKHPPKRKASNDNNCINSKKLKIDVPKDENCSSDQKHETSTTDKHDIIKDVVPKNENGLDNENNCVSKEENKYSTTINFTENNVDVASELGCSSINKNMQNFNCTAWETVDKKTFIKDTFLLEMPDDFYQFWEICKCLNKADPRLAFKEVGLLLIGPYDVLVESFSPEDKVEDNYLLHWRYYYDIPEFQTIIKSSDKSGFHIGYFRDSPDQLPVCLASNCSEKDGVFNICGENIFAAVSNYLHNLRKTADPFTKTHIPKYCSHIEKAAKKLNMSLTLHTDGIKKRDLNVVTKTFNKIGLVVPYNKKTELGYRQLAMSNKELKDLLTKLKTALPEQKQQFLSQLQPVVTFASIAADECDFGTNIELGWNILSCGIDDLNSTVSRIMATSYRLLNRDIFAKIIEVHMKYRQKGSNLSQL